MAKSDLTNGVFGDVLRAEKPATPGRAGKGGGRGATDAPADAFDALAPKDDDAPRSGEAPKRVKLKDW